MVWLTCAKTVLSSSRKFNQGISRLDESTKFTWLSFLCGPYMRNFKSSLYPKTCCYQVKRMILALMQIVLCIKIVFQRLKLQLTWQIKIECGFCWNKNDNHESSQNALTLYVWPSIWDTFGKVQLLGKFWTLFRKPIATSVRLIDNLAVRYLVVVFNCFEYLIHQFVLIIWYA